MLSLEEYQKLPESWVVYRAVGRAVSGGRAVDRDMYWAVSRGVGGVMPRTVSEDVEHAVGRAVGRAVYRDMYWAVRGAFGRGFPND